MEEKVEISLGQFLRNTLATFRYLLSRWMVIAAMGIGLGLLGILYAWLTVPKYFAEITFVADTDNGSKLGGYASLAAQLGFDLGGGSNSAFEGDNLMELLKSKNLVERTLLTAEDTNKPLLIESYIANYKLNKNWEKDQIAPNFRKPAVNFTRVEDSIIGAVSKSIRDKQLIVERIDKKLSFIRISMQDKNEVFAKRFAELLADNAIQFYTDYKSRKSRQNVEILQRQADSVKSMLFGGIVSVAAVTDLNVNPTRQVVKTRAQRTQVDIQTNGAVYTELVKNLELAKLTLRKETPLIQIIDRPTYPLVKKGIGRLFMGLVFGFIGGLIAIVYLLIKRYLVSRSERRLVVESAGV